MTNETESKVNGLTFKEWLAKVDAVLLREVGCTHVELDDFESFDAWDSGTTPEDGARLAIEGDELSDFEPDTDDGDDYYVDHDIYGGGAYDFGDEM